MKNKITNSKLGGDGKTSIDNLLQSSDISIILSSQSSIISNKIKNGLAIYDLDKK